MKNFIIHKQKKRYKEVRFNVTYTMSDRIKDLAMKFNRKLHVAYIMYSFIKEIHR